MDGSHDRGPAVRFRCGNILDARADVIAVTANPGFQLTGGIGGALRARAPADYQGRLNARARDLFGSAPAPRGSVLEMPGPPLEARAVLHVVSLDVFYRTTPQVISDCVAACLGRARDLSARNVALPAFATGYGRFDLAACGRAMASGLLRDAGPDPPLSEVEIWLPTRDRLEVFRGGWDEGVESGRVAAEIEFRGRPARTA